MYDKQQRMEIATRIKEIRTAKNITQEAMADLIDTSYSTYTKIEYGVQNLTVKHLLSLSKALNVATDLILFGKTNDNYSFEDYIKFAKVFNYETLNEMRSNINTIIEMNNKS